MFGAKKDMNKNLSDTIKDTKVMSASYEAGGFRSGSYKKTTKLITALYMVTDIMDINEPLRNKLRTTGLKILSDAHNSLVARTVLATSVEEIMSFLGIASAMNFISEMNCAILEKEFIELRASLQDKINTKEPTWLAEFLSESHPLIGQGGEIPLPEARVPFRTSLHKGRRGGDTEGVKGNSNPRGHTRIGVQKGSTLMQAIKDIHVLSEIEVSDRNSFNILKNERRSEIINIVKTTQNGATISDIKSKASGALISCSEKTLQRELMSMTKDGVLNKTGKKRWSKYFLAQALDPRL